MKNIVLLVGTVATLALTVSAANCSRCGYGQGQGRWGRLNKVYNFNPNIHESRTDQFFTSRDKQILKNIRQALQENNFDDQTNRIQVSVELGKVIMEGRVSSQEEKQNLEQSVSGIQGVKNVVMDVYVDERYAKGNGQQNNRWNNGSQNQRNGSRNNQWGRGRGSQQQQYGSQQQQYGTQRQRDSMGQGNYGSQQGQGTDGALKQQIQDQLTGRWFSANYSNVNVDVSNGVVTLSGFVESEKDKHDVEERVKNVSGVNQVENRVQVQSSSNGNGQNQRGNQYFQPSNGGSNGNQMRQNQNSWQDSEQSYYQSGRRSSNQALRNYGSQTNGQGSYRQSNGASTQKQSSYDSFRQYGSNMRGGSDHDMQKKIQEKLTGSWFSASYPNVNVEVSEGIVTLTGIVEAEKDKSDVENKVRNMSGVKDVRNQIQVSSPSNGDRMHRNQVDQSQSANPKTRYQYYSFQEVDTYSPSERGNVGRGQNYGSQENNMQNLSNDRKLQQKIQDKLTGRWFTTNYPNVNVQVSNGVVTLTGNVNSESDKRDVEKRIKDLSGVKQVRNNLQIQQTAETQHNRSRSNY